MQFIKPRVVQQSSPLAFLAADKRQSSDRYKIQIELRWNTVWKRRALQLKDNSIHTSELLFSLKIIKDGTFPPIHKEHHKVTYYMDDLPVPLFLKDKGELGMFTIKVIFSLTLPSLNPDLLLLEAKQQS